MEFILPTKTCISYILCILNFFTHGAKDMIECIIDSRVVDYPYHWKEKFNSLTLNFKI